MKKHIIIPVLAAALLAPACNDKSAHPSSNPGAVSSLDAFYVDEAPSPARQISEILAHPEPGKEIVFAGEVMGRLHPFVEGRAMVTLGDPTKITPCNRIPGDSCSTPWDNCCTDPDHLKKAIATVQFLDSEGEVIKSGLKGYKGITELSYLTVKGTIAEGSNRDNLLVNVSAFSHTRPSPYVNSPPAEDQGGSAKADGISILDKDGNQTRIAEPDEKE